MFKRLLSYHSTMFRVCIFIALTLVNLVLSLFHDNRLDVKLLFNSSITTELLSCKLFTLLLISMLASYAKQTEICFSNIIGESFILMGNTKGPRMDRLGTQ